MRDPYRELAKLEWMRDQLIHIKLHATVQDMGDSQMGRFAVSTLHRALGDCKEAIRQLRPLTPEPRDVTFTADSPFGTTHYTYKVGGPQ